jgi:transcriptional regulator with XRE-family HTH domain
MDIVNLKEIMVSPGVDERTFGQFVRQCREEKGYSVRAFAKILGCSAAYLSDIEKGNRYAPKKYLDKIFEVLDLPETDRQDFEDLAGATRGFLYEDINSYMGQQPLARVALRTAMEENASDEDWKMFIEGLKKQ